MTQPRPEFGAQAEAPAAMDKEVRVTAPRMHSADLFRESREVEIVHGERIYRLRLTQQNKLILTA